MKIGTRSVLFGVHNPIIHSFFMFWAWVKIHGWTKDLLDPRLHFAFLLHDIGYWGCESMDGPDGEMHPVKGSEIMRKLFGDDWGNLCRWHSGTMVEMDAESLSEYPGQWLPSPKPEPSKLYAVDKLASPLYPRWLYKILSHLSGEWQEYAEIHFSGTVEAVFDRPPAVVLKIEEEDDNTKLLSDFIGYPNPPYHYCSFEDWWHDAMRKMKNRAYQHKNEGTFMTMKESVKNEW